MGKKSSGGPYVDSITRFYTETDAEDFQTQRCLPQAIEHLNSFAMNLKPDSLIRDAGSGVGDKALIHALNI